ncbi:hypothetical protein LCGC14_0613950 [marine sediment metagenome]|uniref:Uncharacterized protein n=1 Tax=marine sediment metagenome TaxID=412755 RepID=A0A0F9R705_9ZZZZ
MDMDMDKLIQVVGDAKSQTDMDNLLVTVNEEGGKVNVLRGGNPTVAAINPVPPTMEAVRKAPNSVKKTLLPPLGYVFAIGPLVYAVTYVNEGKLRFSAVLQHIIDESDTILGPDGQAADKGGGVK